MCPYTSNIIYPPIPTHYWTSLGVRRFVQGGGSKPPPPLHHLLTNKTLRCHLSLPLATPMDFCNVGLLLDLKPLKILFHCTNKQSDSHPVYPYTHGFSKATEPMLEM